MSRTIDVSVKCGISKRAIENSMSIVFIVSVSTLIYYPLTCIVTNKTTKIKRLNMNRLTLFTSLFSVVSGKQTNINTGFQTFLYLFNTCIHLMKFSTIISSTSHKICRRVAAMGAYRPQFLDITVLFVQKIRFMVVNLNRRPALHLYVQYMFKFMYIFRYICLISYRRKP